MWTRGSLKMRARDILRISYFKALLASLVLALVVGDGRMFSFETRDWWDGGVRLMNGEPLQFAETPMLVAGILSGMFFAIIIAIVARIFIGLPIEVGVQKYFVDSTGESFDLNNLGYAFKQGHYKTIVRTMFFRELYIFLWTLLLVIPGIVKHYAYRMVPYILAENPNIDTKRALELSNNMTRGHKFNMWILDLSFIGWYLLGLLAFGLGVFLVMPYENATRAELYIVLKETAFDAGICKETELHHISVD
jgi:hypothetical protein